MIRALIDLSLRHRGMVLLIAAGVILAGIAAVRSTPVDAIPDLSDVQVVIRTPFSGQAPQVVEQQVTTAQAVFLETLRVACEQVAHVQVLHLPVVFRQCSPGGQCSQFDHYFSKSG